MTYQNQIPAQTVAYRVASRLFESAFAACLTLPEPDRQFLLKDVGKRVTKMLAPSKEQGKAVQVLRVEIKQQSRGNECLE